MPAAPLQSARPVQRNWPPDSETATMRRYPRTRWLGLAREAMAGQIAPRTGSL
jgi:hypothetical protein